MNPLVGQGDVVRVATLRGVQGPGVEEQEEGGERPGEGPVKLPQHHASSYWYRLSCAPPLFSIHADLKWMMQHLNFVLGNTTYKTWLL